MKRLDRKIITISFIKYAFLVLLVAINLFPFFSIILNSFRDYQDIIIHPIGISEMSFDNYLKAEQTQRLLRSLLNGAVYSVLSIIMLIICCSMLSYAITKIDIKINGLVFSYVALGYFIPIASILINTYLILRDLSLMNTVLGIVLVYVGVFTSISVITISGYMKTIPKEITESAKIDGASHFTICWRIVFPLSKPVIATMVILLFLWTFREYIWPEILLQPTVQKRPISIALRAFIGERFHDYGQMSAAVFIAIFPIITIFIFLKNKIMSGLTAGAIKG